MKIKFIIFFSIYCLSATVFCNEINLIKWEESSDKGDKDSSFKLSRYYYNSKCYRKAMYWSLRGAEQGSSKCMLLLRHAYGNGHGVIQDTEECLKWLFLAAAIGDVGAQEEIVKLESTRFQAACLVPESHVESFLEEQRVKWDDAQRRARDWMNNHIHLFFNKN
jgi:hypothetical protein